MDKKTWIIGILIGAILEFVILTFIASLWVHSAKLGVKNQYELLISQAKFEAEKTTNRITQEQRENEKNSKERIAALTAERDNLLGWVSNRPSRNDSVASGRSPTTGAQLSREDAEFLIREAARADEVVAERDKYYEDYAIARRALAGSKTSNERLDGEKAN